ncbi:hypothetical protein Bcep1808_6314 [Burkholderia vietnamiensis G4]|uniref:Uncharacterized protein n=1 Tax=Burkholderia vietnamiensis (strain G4 / LMG 22486) TaxID=269482 RepID=A4JSG1_BURVG|nr:hypothetical protein Bcep1808_6314 [Burkholderia vietnamiensis G4]
MRRRPPRAASIAPLGQKGRRRGGTAGRVDAPASRPRLGARVNRGAARHAIRPE